MDKIINFNKFSNLVITNLLTDLTDFKILFLLKIDISYVKFLT
jgi:hypothetical protein